MGMRIDANLSVQPLKQSISFRKDRHCHQCLKGQEKDTVEISNKNKNQKQGMLNKLHTLLAAALLAGSTSCTNGSSEPTIVDTSIFDNIPEYMFEEEDTANISEEPQTDSISEYDEFADLDSLAAQYPIDDCDGVAKTIQQIDSIFDSMSREEQDKFLEFLIEEVRAEQQAEQSKN